MKEDGDAELGGFTTWPETVQFFLRTYAKDQYLEDAVEKLDRLSQGEGDSVMEFYRKLTRSARDLAGAFSQRELITRFQRSLLPSLWLLLRQVRNDFLGPNALTDFAEYATAIHASQQAVTVRSRPTRMAKVLAVEAEPRIKREAYPTTRLEGDDNIALAEPGHGAIPPSRSPTALAEYSTNEVASISLSSQSAPPDPAEYAVPMHSDAVSLVMGTKGSPRAQCTIRTHAGRLASHITQMSATSALSLDIESRNART